MIYSQKLQQSSANKGNGLTQHVQSGSRQEMKTVRLRVENHKRKKKKNNEQGMSGTGKPELAGDEEIKIRLSLTVSPASATLQHCR